MRREIIHCMLLLNVRGSFSVGPSSSSSVVKMITCQVQDSEFKPILRSDDMLFREMAGEGGI